MTLDESYVTDLEDAESLDEFARELERLRDPSRAGSAGSARNPLTRVNADSDNVEQGLAKLVLSLVELLRQLLEKQALRRMESGTLDEDEIERLGVTFMKLKARIEELKSAFGLENEDLNIDLGPLGKLLEDQQTPVSRQ